MNIRPIVLLLALVATLVVIGCSAAPTPTLLEGEAESALRNFLLKEALRIRIAEKRQEVISVIEHDPVTVSYNGSDEWTLTGAGLTRTAEGQYRWVTGRWKLAEATLEITPINSEAATFLEFLDTWISAVPPSPTRVFRRPIYLTPTPKPTSKPYSETEALAGVRNSLIERVLLCWESIRETALQRVSHSGSYSYSGIVNGIQIVKGPGLEYNDTGNLVWVESEYGVNRSIYGGNIYVRSIDSSNQLDKFLPSSGVGGRCEMLSTISR